MSGGRVIRLPRRGRHRPPVEVSVTSVAEHLHRLGPRPTYELLREIAASAAVVERLERYAALTSKVVRAVGAEEMPLVAVAVPEANK